MIDFAREDILSVKKAAEWLGVSARTVERWIERGLECRKFGRKVFTSKQALNRFADAADLIEQRHPGEAMPVDMTAALLKAEFGI